MGVCIICSKQWGYVSYVANRGGGGHVSYVANRGGGYVSYVANSMGYVSYVANSGGLYHMCIR